MVHRDPETGQFMAGMDSSRMFRDYEFQHVESEYSVAASALPGAFPITVTDLTEIELDDVLLRDERADLISLNVHSLQASIPGTSSAESALGVRYEISAGNGSETVEDADFQTDTGIGPGGNIDRNVARSDDPDVLYFASWNAEAGYADSASGLGGGPDQPVLQDQVHYPRDFGACPRFDERDEITESFSLNDRGSASIEDSVIELKAAYTLTFDVMDRDG